MKPRTASRLAWSIGIFSIVLMIGAVVLMFIDRNAALPAGGSSAEWNFSNVLNAAVNMLVPALGVVLASRRPKNSIGWLFLAAGAGLGISSFAVSYGLHAVVTDPGSLPAGRLFAWMGNSFGLVALGVLAFLFLLFPTGHLRSRRWRPVAWFVAGSFTLVTLSTMVYATQTWNDPYKATQSGGVLLGLLLFAVPLLGSLVASCTAVVVRYRGSVGDERLQLKWFATAAALVVLSFVASFLSSSSEASSPPAIVSVFQSLAFIFLWVAIGVAVLKYRLYEINVVISKTLVYGLIAAFFTAVYVVVVVGLGSAIGSSHNTLLTLVAAAVIALAFNPARTRATRLANRIVYGKRASPYEVLSKFSERFSGTYSVEDVLPQMAELLGEGTGARQTRVWLRVGDELRPEAVWGEVDGEVLPLAATDDRLPEITGASKVVAVRHQNDLLGALSVTKPPSEPLTAADDKLVDDFASQAGLVLRNVRLTEELRANLEALRESRQRIVAAQDEERRRIERNIHDGAQQQLVALAVKANLAETMIVRDPDKARLLIGQLKTEAGDALDDLRDLARGIYPPLLADKGLGVALDAQAKKAPVAVDIDVEIDQVTRYPQEMEAAVYFCCLEALQNVAKYSGADSARIHLFAANGSLVFEVSDQGKGFDSSSTDYGTGLRGMADRLDALGGSLDVRSRPGKGTTVVGTVPAGQQIGP